MSGSEADRAETAGVVAPPPLILLAALLLGFGLEALVPTALLGPALDRVPRLLLGGAVVAVALGLAVVAGRRFSAAGTEVKPWKPSTALVVVGPYRWTRNPMYLGMLILQAGAGIMADSLWLLALLVPLWAALRYAVIAREERYLDRLFGQDYRDYKDRVRRWI